MPNLKFLNIPPELRERKQWAVATLIPQENGKPDKAPRHFATGARISSTDPQSWCTFEQALNSGYPAIGYMLSSDDPYTIIDLDTPDEDCAPEDAATISERQKAIYSTFESYAEKSQSGLGVHIIIKAKINGGRNRDSVEIYDQERFIICTGDVIRQHPVVDYQDVAAVMVANMGGVKTADDIPTDQPETMSDDELIRKASSAKNGQKFNQLFTQTPREGDDWSRLDASLAQIIAFYTRNHDQALRVFRRSALYRPHSKGKNVQHYEEYYLLEKTFARAWRAEQMRDADLDHGKTLAAQLLAQDKVNPPNQEETIKLPAGLVGDIASFIYGASQRPVIEIAIAGALTFLSGVVGRQYNISNTGLNLYIVLLAETGRGKEAAAAGVDMLIADLRQKMPIVDTYRGPGHIASGQGLVRHLDENPCCFSFLSEFGHTLKTITSPRANAADIRTKQVLLDLFAKSGQKQMLHSSAYSDKDKNTKMVQAPCYAFMGDTTPDGYYDQVSSGLIGEGFIPRLMTIEYAGPRTPRNVDPITTPSQALSDRLITLFTSLANMSYSNTFMDVGIAPDAGDALDKFDKECDAKINASRGLAEMWNRAHLKVLRLSAILAVGVNHFEPIISLEQVQWSIKLVKAEVARLADRIHKGAVGESDTRQESVIVEMVRDYVSMSPDQREKYGVPKILQERGDVISYTYLRRRLRMHKQFAQDRRGTVIAVKTAIADLVDAGILQELSESQINEINLVGAGMSGRPFAGAAYTLGPSFE